MTIPDFFTRADVPGTAENVARTAAAAGEVAGEFGLDDMEKIFKFADRAEKLIEKAGNQIMRMREFEARGQRTNVDGDSVDQRHVVDDGRVMGAEKATGPTGAQVGQITAEKVYMKVLGSLNEMIKRDPKMTVTEALALAKQHKVTVIAGIEAALIEMATPE